MKRPTETLEEPEKGDTTNRRCDPQRLLAACDPQPSDAAWILCADATNLRERLAPHGVLVRDCASFGLPGQARVAVPDEAGLERLEEALCRLEG